ncbi:hypothetical protein D9M71_815650 [compost metagenome]
MFVSMGIIAAKARMAMITLSLRIELRLSRVGKVSGNSTEKNRISSSIKAGMP